MPTEGKMRWRFCVPWRTACRMRSPLMRLLSWRANVRLIRVFETSPEYWFTSGDVAGILDSHFGIPAGAIDNAAVNPVSVFRAGDAYEEAELVAAQLLVRQSTANKRRYVLRIDSEEVSAFGIDRRT